MKHTSWLFFLTYMAPTWAADEINSILTVAGELDDQSSRYLMLGFDRRLSDNTWLSLAANYVDLNDKSSNSNAQPTDSSSQFASVGLSHTIGQWNLSLGVDHWQVEGDNLVSTDINGGLYYRFEKWSFGIDLVRRDTTLRFTVPATGRQPSDDVVGNGYGLGGSYSPNDAWYFYGSYMEHDYDGQIIKRPEYDVFSRFSFTADDSLLDHNLLLGADYYWLRYSIGFYTSEYRSAFDNLATAVYNLSGKMLLSGNVDMQLNLGITRPDDAGDSVYGGVGLTVYW